MRFIIAIALLIATAAHADVVNSNTTGHVVAFTNAQSNFSWTPKAVGIIYTSPVNASVTITRHGNGNVLTLSSNTFTAKSTIWIPPGQYYFPQHSSLVISSSVAGFTVQLHRGEHD